MGEKALWPTVCVVFIVCAMLTAMVIAGIEPVTILAIIGVLFTGIGSLVSVLLYGKMVKVEQNTNGNIGTQQEIVKRNQDAMQDMLKQLIEYLKVSTPIDAVKKEE